MGIDQLSEPCRACGHPKRYRQSCANCASMERAKLHAAGVASCEEARYQPDAGTFANPAVKQPELTLDGIRDAMRKVEEIATRGGLWRLPDATAVPEAEQELVWPKVGEECSWEVAECHMRRDASATYKHTVDGEMFRHRCERGCHMYWDKRHSEWRVSQASRSYLARGEWVRLA